MNDFTKNFAQALFEQEKINDLFRKKLQQAVNDFLEAELTGFLGFDPYARDGWYTANSRNSAYFRKVEVWTERLQNMRARSLKQVELFISDGVVGTKSVLAKTYPKAHFQRCLVHVMRNICNICAKVVLHEFYAKWNKAYGHVVRGLKDIESFNSIIKRKAKPKAEFSTEQSVDTFVGTQAMSYNSRYFNRIHEGFGQIQDTLESYFD